MNTVCTVSDEGIPLFLQRPEQRTPEHREYVLRLVQEINNPRSREWIMPDRAKYLEEEEMARAENILIVNAAAPIEIWARNEADNDTELVHTFADKAAFELWYNPKRFKNLGGRSTQELTSVMIDAPASSIDVTEVGPRSLGKKQQPRAPRPEDHGYIVNSHIGLLLKGKGFRRIHVPKEEPMTFKHPDGRTVLIPAPAADKKSSSHWVVQAADGKQTAKGFGLSLKDKL